MICLLYKVADNVEYDSYEHFEEFSKEIKKELKKSKLFKKKNDFISDGSVIIPSGETQANDDAEHEYRYSFDAGMLVLRTKNYSDVIYVDTIPEIERENHGFWFADNSSSNIQYDNMVFRTENSGKDIVRYDSRGIAKRIFKSDGTVQLIACEADTLFFYYQNNNKESYYQINNCTSDNYLIEQIAEMYCASDLDYNLWKDVFTYGEWTYFIYEDKAAAGGCTHAQDNLYIIGAE